jgi:hypothetical protein
MSFRVDDEVPEPIYEMGRWVLDRVYIEPRSREKRVPNHRILFLLTIILSVAASNRVANVRGRPRSGQLRFKTFGFNHPLGTGLIE